MTQRGRFKIDVYNCVVYICYADSEESFLRSINYYFRKHDEEKELTCSKGYAFSPSSSDTEYYLFFHKKDLSVEILNHEKSHIVDFILEDRNIQTTDEARSYLDGFISHKLTLFFTSHGIKIKNKR